MDEIGENNFIFSEYSDDSSEILDTSNIAEKSTNPYNILINKILQHRATNNTSYKAACEFARTLNLMPGSQIEVPTSKKTLKKEVQLKYSFLRYIVCKKCNCLVQESEKLCPICGFISKKSKNNYFIYIPLVQQIKSSIRKYAKEIVEFRNNSKSGDYICDYFDGSVYKTVKEKIGSNDILPLTLNVDGGKIFSSSCASLWPIQLLQLYLPPHIRYRDENILVVGLYCGLEKPDLPSIISPLVKEFNSQQLLNVCYAGEIIQFMPVLMFAACDIPARAQLQNCKCSGYYGCPVCEHPGVLVSMENPKKSFVRFLAQSQPSIMRTHNDSIKIGYGIYNEKKSENTKGIKAISCMIGFKHFDLIKSFTIDYMHGSTEGVMKLLIEIWMGKRTLRYTESEKKIFQFKGLSNANRTIIINRLLQLKPYHRINHKPRSLQQLGFFSANEYRSLMWYYLKFALYNILPTELVKHFELFSAATYMLSKTKISKYDITEAAQMLNVFCNDFEKFYGKNSVTLNVHMLRHYSTMVENTGPLWTHSLFSFESKMGTIKRMRKSSVDVVENIAFNYCLANASEFKSTKKNNSASQILRPNKQKLSIEIRNILIDSHVKTNKYGEFVVGYEFKKDGIIFKSAHSKATKSVDSFIRLNDNSIGEIECFIKSDHDHTVCVVKIYDLVKKHFHLNHVKPTKKYRVCECDDIAEQLIHLKYQYSRVAYVEIVTSEPNLFEGN